MAKLLNIYLSQQPQPNIGKWEIYREGKPTGEMIANSTIRKILDQDQYKEFLLGDTIFLIPGNRFRSRNHKPKEIKSGRAYRNKRRIKNG